jgi:hypothetical protein
MPSKAISTYLKDHLAGSTGGVSLARRLADGADDPAERKEMSALADEIEADGEKLVEIMDRLEVPPSRFKQAGAWIGQKLSAVKLNATAPDARVLQYEAMIMGVTGKLQLWRSLAQIEPGQRALDSEEIAGFARDAEEQRRRLEKLHGNAARFLAGD